MQVAALELRPGPAHVCVRPPQDDALFVLQQARGQPDQAVGPAWVWVSVWAFSAAPACRLYGFLFYVCICECCPATLSLSLSVFGVACRLVRPVSLTLVARHVMVQVWLRGRWPPRHADAQNRGSGRCDAAPDEEGPRGRPEAAAPQHRGQQLLTCEPCRTSL